MSRLGPGLKGRRHLSPLEAGGPPARGPSSASLFSFGWNTVSAIQLDLLDRLSVYPFFQRRDIVKYLEVST